jgi:hypothetical protein
VIGGERNLERLLANLQPQLCADRYAFAAGPEDSLQPGVFAIIREGEGLTVVRADPEGDWARISLGVHSSLEAVGLTAALSSQLAEAGISANIVAALHHDHIFVPWDRREQALDCICALSTSPPFA